MTDGERATNRMLGTDRLQGAGGIHVPSSPCHFTIFPGCNAAAGTLHYATNRKVHNRTPGRLLLRTAAGLAKCRRDAIGPRQRGAQGPSAAVVAQMDSQKSLFGGPFQWELQIGSIFVRRRNSDLEGINFRVAPHGKVQNVEPRFQGHFHR